MLCHYWYFEDAAIKFESHVCNKCCDVLMTAYVSKEHCNVKCKTSRSKVRMKLLID